LEAPIRMRRVNPSERVLLPSIRFIQNGISFTYGGDKFLTKDSLGSRIPRRGEGHAWNCMPLPGQSWIPRFILYRSYRTDLRLYASPCFFCDDRWSICLSLRYRTHSFPEAPASWGTSSHSFFLGLEFHLFATYLSINIGEFLLVLHKMICFCYLNYTFICFWKWNFFSHHF
jgi:hypothetical protein